MKLERTAVGAGIWVLLNETVLWLVPGDIRPSATAGPHDDTPPLTRKGWSALTLEKG